MLNALVIIVAALAFLLGMIFNAPVVNVGKNRKGKNAFENAKEIDLSFNPDPMMSDKLTNGTMLKYTDYLRDIIEVRGAVELCDLVELLQNQEQRIHFLYERIVVLLQWMNIEKNGYPHSTLQKNFDDYADNRLDICRIIRAYVDTKDMEQKMKYRLTLNNIAIDNQDLMEPLESFYESLRDI